MTRTLVIAEIGSCHDNSLGKALNLVDAAADAGADIVKIQWWSDPDALAARRHATDYYRDIYRRYQIPLAWLGPICRVCHERRVMLGITTYLPGDVPITSRLADCLKIASFEAEARDLLEAHIKPVIEDHLPLIISLGMGARKQPYAQFHGRERYLHCVSAYPAPVEALNLATLWPREIGQKPDGFSDHSDPAFSWTGALAVAAGASIIEAHLRLLDTDLRNPDAPHAMVPDQFRDYVRNVRFAERCIGTAADSPILLPCEEPMAAYRVRTS